MNSITASSRLGVFEYLRHKGKEFAQGLDVREVLDVRYELLYLICPSALLF